MVVNPIYSKLTQSIKKIREKISRRQAQLFLLNEENVNSALLKKDVKVSGIVAVIGGGSTAIDAARSALRLGAQMVHILYRRTREEMPADKREIEEAIDEGVILQELVAPVRFIGYGKVSRIECVKMMPGKFGKDGRRVPVVIPDSNFMIDIDMAIPAVSQYSYFPFITKAEVGITDWGTFIVDSETQMTT